MLFAPFLFVDGGREEVSASEDVRPSPKWQRAVSKLAGGHYCRVFARLEDNEMARTVGARFGPDILARFPEASADDVYSFPARTEPVREVLGYHPFVELSEDNGSSQCSF